MGTVRRPHVAYNAVGKIFTHGQMWPVRFIIHSTESHDAAGLKDLEGIVGFWRRQSLGYGAHLVIDSDGNTAICASPEQKTWHTYKRNTGSIGIELVGFARFSPHAWFLRIKQLRELARWLAYYSDLYAIPLRFSTDRGVAGHRHHSKEFGGTHWDPGFSFPFGFVIRLAKKYKAHGWPDPKKYK